MDKTLGARFKLIRERKLQMTQTQVAEVLGVTPSTISKIESFKLNHELGHRILTFAELANVTVEFLEGKDDPIRVDELCPLYVEALSLPEHDYREVVNDIRNSLDRVNQRHRNQLQRSRR